MRVLAVAQVAELRRGHVQPARHPGLLLRQDELPVPLDELAQLAGDATVVAGRVREGGLREGEAKTVSRSPGAIQLRQHLVVPVRLDDHEDVAEILGRGPHQARATDVDLLDESRRR